MGGGLKTALCTCAMDPDATGFASKDLKTSNNFPLGRCKLFSTCRWVNFHECAGASACKLAMDAQSPSGNISDRVDAH
eukprot:scaffold491_cov47-Attheya_sp.AAC.2